MWLLSLQEAPGQCTILGKIKKKKKKIQTIFCGASLAERWLRWFSLLTLLWIRFNSP